MTYQKIILAVVLFFILHFVFSQNKFPVADSIDSQFSELINSSNTFQDYKVVKIQKINSLKNEVKSSISTLEEDIDNLEKDLKNQAHQSEEYKNKLTDTQSKLEKANISKDQLSLLGMNIQKSTYTSSILILISLLFATLMVFVYKFKNAHRTTNQVKENLKSTESEFAEYKRKALETQQKLGRQIIDERNKIKETSH